MLIKNQNKVLSIMSARVNVVEEVFEKADSTNLPSMSLSTKKPLAVNEFKIDY